MRAIGWLILTSGLIGAAVLYWVQTRAADPQLDDVRALGYTRSLQHGMGVMMGPSGALLTEWQQRLTSPLGEALMLAVGAALLAGYFFRVAWVIDSDDGESSRLRSRLSAAACMRGPTATEGSPRESQERRHSTRTNFSVNGLANGPFWFLCWVNDSVSPSSL